MGDPYVNPPVVEALCEFRLSSDTPWDLTVPGLLYEKIRDEFPTKEQRLVQEVQLSQGREGIQQQIRASDRIILFADQRNLFVQIGSRLLVINALKPYPSWTGFKPKIAKAWGSLCETADVKGLERIGLRYINRIDLPGPAAKLEEYFEFYPFLGPKLPQEMVSFIAGSDFSYANDRDRCRLLLTNFPSDVLDRRALLLDIDYFLAQPKGIEPPAALDWVEEAHKRVEEIFEGCIQDRLRDLFRREVT